MCKKGWCVGLGQEGGCMRVGGTVLNTLKGGGTEKRGGETDSKKGVQGGSRGGCLKKGGAGTPLRTMVLLLKSFCATIRL